MQLDLMFYVLIAIFFFFGVIYEVLSLRLLSRNWKNLENHISFLKSNKPVPITNRQEYRWQREHFAGISQPGSFKPDKDDNRFRLIKYPSEIATISRSTIRFIPPILTAIGILGTFWGITQGLQGINIDPSDAAKSLESATKLIDGMKTAFYTSLFGLGSSTLLSSILAGTDKLRKDKCVKLRQSLAEIATLQTAESSLAKLNFDVTFQASQQLSNLAAQFNADAIGKAVGIVVGDRISDAIEQHLRPTFTRIEETNSNFEVLVREQRETLSNLVMQMRNELIIPVTDRLDKSGELLNRSSSSLDEASSAIQRLNSDLAGIAKELGESSVVLERFQKETIQNLQDFVASLRTVLDQFREETSSALIQTAQEIRSGTIEILQESRQTFQEQNTILQSIGTEASNQMNFARASLVEGLEGIDSRLAQMSSLTQEQLNQFRQAYQQNLQEFFEKQNNLLEQTLGEQRDGLAEVVRELNNVFTNEYERRKEMNAKLDHQMEIFRQNTNKAIALATAIENSYSQRIQQLNEISETVADQVERIESSNLKLTQANDQSIRMLEQALSRMIDGEMKFFDEADSAMAKVSSGLLEAAQVLVEVRRQT